MRASGEHVIHFQELQESICHIWDNITQTKSKEEASEMCWRNATINLIGRCDMLAKYNNLPLNK
jgi:hypothetical protein